MKFLVVVHVVAHLFLATEACTEIRVPAEDSSVIIGRSMEFQVDLKSNVVIEPKGHSHTAILPEKCVQPDLPMRWQNKHSIAYLDAFDLPVGCDGQNEAGLSVGALYFPGFAKYQNVSEQKCYSSISQLEFAMWILGNFATVQELREALEKDSFPLVWDQPLMGDPMDHHYSVQDKTGDGIVIEYTDQGRKVYDNTIGVVTNSPPYDFQMLNIRNYIQISKYAHDPLVLGKEQFNATGQGNGLLGIPGDLTPPSRLVRAAAMVHFADPVQTAEEAVNLAFHTLNTVDIPIGVARGVVASRDDKSDYTQWAVAKDLTNNVMYFRSY